jgi:hypothetical protein
MNRSPLAGLWAAALLLTSLVLPGTALAETRTICSYAPGGKANEYSRIADDFAVQAKLWGVDVQIKVHTDEETAAKDYEAGHCDGVIATGVRLQKFNRYSSTIEAIGAITNYDAARRALTGIAVSSSAASRLVAGDHETAGILPAGLVYLFLRDRSVDTVAELAGKKIATMSYDKAAPVMVNRVGAVMVSADLGSFGPLFNNGSVDACYMAGLAYQAFELHKGIGTKGGVVKLPLALGTLQLLIRHKSFPAEFGKKSREWFASQFDRALVAVKAEDAKIPAASWIPVPATELAGFDDMFLQVRLELRDVHKAYDANMLAALRAVRCQISSTRSECAEKKE